MAPETACIACMCLNRTVARAILTARPAEGPADTTVTITTGRGEGGEREGERRGERGDEGGNTWGRGVGSEKKHGRMSGLLYAHNSCNSIIDLYVAT